MKESEKIIAEVTGAEYGQGFETVVEQEFVPKGLDENIIRLISAKRRNRPGCWNSASRPSGSGRR